MYTLFENLLNHKVLYKTSLIAGIIFTSFIDFITELSIEKIFGTSFVIWFLVFFINIIDIYTGIKADTKRRQRLGEKFVFESNKGWRAIEKIFVFTVVIAFIHYLQREVIILELPDAFVTMFTYVKITMFFYVVLVEIQSIGENEMVRYGKKSKLFYILDNIILTVNEGIIYNARSLFRLNKNEDTINEDTINEDEEP